MLINLPISIERCVQQVKEILCQALSDALGCKPHILFAGLCNCFGNWTLPLAQPVFKDANSNTYLKLRMPKQWSAILGGKAMESVLIHHHRSARAYYTMASLVLCRVGRPCSVMIQCPWALIMLLYCTRDLPCVSCGVGYENGKQWKFSEAHCSRNLHEILPFFKLTLRHKQQLILFWFQKIYLRGVSCRKVSGLVKKMQTAILLSLVQIIERLVSDREGAEWNSPYELRCIL